MVLKPFIRIAFCALVTSLVTNPPGTPNSVSSAIKSPIKVSGSFFGVFSYTSLSRSDNLPSPKPVKSMPPNTKSMVLKPRFLTPVSSALFISSIPSIYLASGSVPSTGVKPFAKFSARTGYLSKNVFSSPPIWF